MTHKRRRWILAATLLALGAWPLGCESTAPAGHCVKCRCECQSSAATKTTTFESRDSAGALIELDCSLKGDCVQECARVGAPTPVTATCVLSN
jgi:hypothetical protein